MIPQAFESFGVIDKNKMFIEKIDRVYAKVMRKSLVFADKAQAWSFC
jgi:hypothetical protein